jgi:protein-S-isoprenylcysteine O-methyltransferase Ste14
VSRTLAVLGSLGFLVLAPGTLAGYVPWAITGWRAQPPFLGWPGSRAAGAVALVAGLAVLLDAFARFALEGRGTPAPVAPTERLVVSGLYRHVRNPMYLAVLAIVLGEALVLGSRALVLYAALVGLGSHLFVVTYEEPTLRRRYGREYEEYCSAVGRWLPRRL